MIYLADTNIVSEIMRPHPHAGVQAQWRQQYAQIAISAVTWHELLVGTMRLPASKRRSAFERFLYESLVVTIPILPYDQAAAAWQARERVRLTQLGRKPAYADSQIAAIAATQKLILVTRNTADFAGFSDLRVENWFAKN